MALTREQLLAAAKGNLQVEEVEHPTLGAMRLREMSARQRVEWQQTAQKPDKAAEVAAYVLAASLVDEKDKALFKNDGEALLWLNDVPASVSDPIFEAIFSLNGLTQEAAEAAAENFPAKGGSSSA